MKNIKKGLYMRVYTKLYSTYKGKKQNPVAEVSKSFVPTRDSIESPIVPKKADSTKREREPERSTNVASKKFRSEDSKDTTSQGKINSTHEEDKDAKGNPTISVKDALDASALPKYVAALSGSQSKVTLSDLVKYISKEKGIPKSELKRRLLKKMKLSVQDGRVTFV